MGGIPNAVGAVAHTTAVAAVWRRRAEVVLGAGRCPTGRVRPTEGVSRGLRGFVGAGRRVRRSGADGQRPMVAGGPTVRFEVPAAEVAVSPG